MIGNSELQERMAEQMEFVLSQTPEALATENAKLRELARKMWKPFCWAQSGYDVCLSDEKDMEIRDLARELRIEVSD